MAVGARGGRGSRVGRVRGGDWSAERCDALVGGEERVGVGPAVEAPDDVASTLADDAGRGVPEAPAQRLGFDRGEGPGEAQELESGNEIGGEADGGEPGLVGVEVGEREPLEPGGFTP